MLLMLVLLAAAAAAAHQAVTRAQLLDRAAGRIASIDASHARAAIALAELAAAERGYVAPGQGLDFWAGKADEWIASAREALSSLQSVTSDAGAAAQIAAAASRLDDFTAMDQRARDYARDGQRSMASDLIFADGYEILAAARQEVAGAVSIERAALTAPIARDRQLHLASIGVLGACALIGALLLLRGPRPSEPAVTPIAAEPFPVVQPDRSAAADDSIGAALDASLEGLDDFASPPSIPSTPSIAEPAGARLSSAHAAAPAVDLASAADVCVDLARLLDARDLQNVLARIAGVLEANGLIVWLADASGASLAPALTYGYAPSLVARLGSLSVEEDNPTSAAWRSKATQVVKGALAVPLLTSGGCTGVLAVELKDGQERASDVQSLARIVAAQLAASVSAPAADAPRAAEA